MYTATEQLTDQNETPVLEARTRDTVNLKHLLNTANALVDDMPIIVNADGIHLVAADSAMVAMIDLHLTPDLFGRFNCKAKDPIRFQVDMNEFADRVSEAKQGDDVTLTVRDDPVDGYMLDVTVWHEGITSTFTLETDSIDDTDIPDVDKLEFSGSVLVSLSMLRAAIQKMGDSVTLTLDKDALLLESTVDDQEARVRFPDTSDHLHAIALSDDAVQSTYSQDYLSVVRKLRKTVDRIRLQFGDDFPLRVWVDDDRFKLRYTLAPRIEE
jgi:proliferating cell nuclear antigen PCNA